MVKLGEQQAYIPSLVFCWTFLVGPLIYLANAFSCSSKHFSAFAQYISAFINNRIDRPTLDAVDLEDTAGKGPPTQNRGSLMDNVLSTQMAAKYLR